jgi:hypothetical protein
MYLGKTGYQKGTSKRIGILAGCAAARHNSSMFPKDSEYGVFNSTVNPVPLDEEIPKSPRDRQLAIISKQNDSAKLIII